MRTHLLLLGLTVVALSLNAQQFREVTCGPNYTLSTYFKFGNEESISLEHNAWDIAFTAQGMQDAGIFINEAAGKPCITYDELVEECLCFGWIDRVVKKLDEASNVQRITPRRKKKTFLSELNRQRVWKLQRAGLMTPAGIAPIEDQIGSPDDPWEIPDWEEAQLREDEAV